MASNQTPIWPLLAKICRVILSANNHTLERWIVGVFCNAAARLFGNLKNLYLLLINPFTPFRLMASFNEVRRTFRSFKQFLL